MIRASILLLAACAAAGCSGAPGGNDQAAAVADDAVAAANSSFVSPNLAGGSWAGVFADPQSSIDHFNRIGLRVGPYEKMGDSWRAEAVPTAMTDPSAPNLVQALFTAAGSENALQRVTFTLVEPIAANDQQARDQFDAWMTQALSQLGVPGGDTAVAAIHGQKRMTGALKGGAEYAVTRGTTPTERHVAVTFSRAAPITNMPITNGRAAAAS